MERFILECKYVDKLHRVRNSDIVGVYRTLTEVQNVMAVKLQERHEYRREWEIKVWTDPVHNWVGLDTPKSKIECLACHADMNLDPCPMPANCPLVGVPVTH